jgi:peptidoglycan/LPS O-acetylase OafA/YrhL
MRRVPELDALRGLAALAIVVHHLWLSGYGFVATAVDLFFVMSGYLITSIILTQLDRPQFLLMFYARRALRIWPIYYLSLLAFVAINPLLPHPAPLDGLPYYLTYTQRIENYWLGSEPPFYAGFDHAWTLAIEEQFYIIWPLLIVWLGRKSVVPVGLAMIAAAIAARTAGIPTWVLLTRCDGLALGGLLAVFLNGREAGARSPAKTEVFLTLGTGAIAYLVVAAALPPLLPGSSWARALSLFGPRMFVINLMYVSLIGLVACHSGERWLAPLRDRRLCYLGQTSYGIYLYHYILGHLLREWGSPAALLGRAGIDVATLTLTLVVAALSWRYVERPLLALKDRVSYPSGRAAVEDPRLDTLSYEGS